MNERIHNFVSHLERLAGKNAGSNGIPDRQALAALRRCFTTWPSLPAEAIRIVAPFTPKRIGEVQESIYYLIAALFATHPESVPSTGQSLGAALARASENDTSKGAERALLILLRCKQEDLSYHLRHTFSYLRARGVPLDYRQLMYDLDHWESEKSFVQRRWARDFWAQDSDSATTSTTQETQNVH